MISPISDQREHDTHTSTQYSVAAEGVVSYSLLVNKSTVHGAIGAGLVTLFLGDSIRAYLNDFPEGFGMYKTGLIFNILFGAANIHALLTDQSYAVPLTLAL